MYILFIDELYQFPWRTKTAMIFESTSIRHRSALKVLERCRFDVDPRIIAVSGDIVRLNSLMYVCL